MFPSFPKNILYRNWFFVAIPSNQVNVSEGYDQKTYKDVYKIAMKWKKYGEIPPPGKLKGESQ